MAVQRLQVVLDAQDNASAKIHSVQGKMQGFGAQLKSIAGAALPWLGLTAAIGGAVAGIKQGIRVTMDFEKAMSNVATLVDTGTESMEQMGKEVLDMSKRMPVSIEDLTSALYDVRSAGIAASDAMTVLESSGRLAVAGLGTTKEAVNLLTSSINVFSKQGYSAYEMSNILFKTVKYGKTTVAGLAQAFGMVAPLAGALNVKLAELEAATAALTTTGMTASIAQHQLRAGMSNLLKPTAEMKELMDAVGVSSAGQLVSIYGLVGGYKVLRDASKGNTEMFAKAMGSVEGLNAALFLTGEGAKAFTSMLADMESGTDSLTEAFEKQKETAAAQYAMFKNNLNVIMIDIGQRTIPYLIDALQLLLRAFNYVTTGAKLSTLGFEKLYASAAYLKNAITGNEKEMRVWSDVLGQIEEEAQDVMIGFDSMTQELDLMKEGLKSTTTETQALQEQLEETGEEAEKAFEKAVKGVKEIRDEIRDTYKEIEDATEDYKNKVTGLEYDKGEEIVRLVADTERDIKELNKDKAKALEQGDTEEVESIERKIAEKQVIIDRFYKQYTSLEDELAERKKYLAMDEIGRIEADYERKKMLAEKEYLEGEITRVKKLIALTQEHETAMSFIGEEKEAAIQAEIEKEMTFREKLQSKTESLKNWIEEQKSLYRGYAESIGGIFGGLIPTTRTPLKAYQFGTSYVPKTGAYMLHEGEAVTPARGSTGAVYNFNFAGAFIGDKIAFQREIINLINRQSELRTLAGE